MNAPAFWTYTKPRQDAPDYYSEADLDRWQSRVLDEAMAFIEASYRKEFGIGAPDLNKKELADSLHDGLSDAVAPFFTEIIGG